MVIDVVNIMKSVDFNKHHRKMLGQHHYIGTFMFNDEFGHPNVVYYKFIFLDERTL